MSIFQRMVLLTMYASQIGSAIEVALLSLALADRINAMREQLARQGRFQRQQHHQRCANQPERRGPAERIGMCRRQRGQQQRSATKQPQQGGAEETFMVGVASDRAHGGDPWSVWSQRAET